MLKNRLLLFIIMYRIEFLNATWIAAVDEKEMQLTYYQWQLN